MDVVYNIVTKLLEPLIDCLLTSTWRQVDYVVHYEKNINSLENEVEELRDCTERVEGEVDRAKDQGMKVKKEVLDWQGEVESALERYEVLNKELKKENLSCLDVCSRHQLGSKVKELTIDVTGLKDKGKAYKFPEVAHPPRLTDIWDVSSTKFEQFETRNSVFNKIMEAMKDDRNYKIGIYGMPGVGKTAMVEEVAKQAGKGLFDEVARAVFSQNPDLRKIQGQLADCLNLTLNKESEEGRAAELRNRLKNGRKIQGQLADCPNKESEEGRAGEQCHRLKKGGKILVILDDVWDDQITLKQIGIPDDIDNSKDGKILLTSRRREVCNQMGFEKNFEIGLLSELEAWQLFTRRVGDYIEADLEIRSVARKVCKECDCLPVAILAVGGALKDEKERRVWEYELEQLRNSQGRLTENSPIEWSYNYLKSTDLKSCFLHCVLFPEDTEISIDVDLVSYGVGIGFFRDSDTMEKARDKAHMLVRTLKKSYLLLEGRNENFVKMHDVIRDVAISIASKAPNMFFVKDAVKVWPEKNDYKCCTTISLRTSHDVRRLPDQLVCEELRTLVLGCNTTDGLQLELPNSFFELMKKLEVLDLCNINLVQSSISNMVNLRMLRLRFCKLVDLSFLKNFKNLEILRIDHFDFQLKVDEVGQLHHLRSLDLRECNCPMTTIFQSGVLSHLSGLEELYLPLSFDKWGDEGNVSIGELHCLSSLTSLHICIPKHIIILLPNNDLPSFQSLTTFHILIGDDDNSRWYNPGEYTETKILRLSSVPWKVKYNVLMKKVEVLYLINLEGARKVLHQIDTEWFLDLKSLVVEKCDDMEHHLLGKPQGPCPLGSFGKLSRLEVSECRSIKYLFSPSTARGLSNLQKLIIGNCEMLEEIVGGDEEVMDKLIFHQLKELKLRYLSNLRSIYSNTKKTSTSECHTSTNELAFFNEKVTFPVLEKLYIEKLNSITAIWGKQLLLIQEAENSFEHLQQLHVKECEKIEKIVAFEIGQGEEAETSDEIVMFTKLKILRLEELPRLKSFCKSHGSEKEETSEEGIHEIQALFSHKVIFPVWEELYIEKLNSITAIWGKQLLPLQEAENSFEHLQQLHVKECEKIEKIIAFEIGQGEEADASDEIVMFTKLKILRLEELPRLKSFCKCHGSEKEETSEEGIPEIQAIFNRKVSFPVLEELFIEDLDRITAIWDKQLLPIQEADTSYEIAMFTKLKILTLKKLPSLKSFCKSRGSEKKETSEEDIPEIQALFNCKVAFPMLEELTLYEGNLFEHIWNAEIPASSSSKLRVLTVTGNDFEYLFAASLEVTRSSKLVNFPPNLLQRFEAIEELTLFGCLSLEAVVGFNREELNAIVRQEFLVFNNLTTLKVKFCKSLRYLFSLSIATTGFTQLQRLTIRDCDLMEEIVRNEEEGAEDGRDKIVILFPRLEDLHLYDLPKLRSFCEPNNIAFQLPSLNHIDVGWCDQIWTTSGGTRKPVTSLFGHHLHKTLHQQINHYLHKKASDNYSTMEWRRPRDDETNEDEVEGESSEQQL